MSRQIRVAVSKGYESAATKIIVVTPDLIHKISKATSRSTFEIESRFKSGKDVWTPSTLYTVVE